MKAWLFNLSFTDFIMGNGTLQCTFEPTDFRVSFRKMLLADATVHPLSPEVEAASFQFAPH
jgi:hypothetical protein